ncbi:hypothetical protein JZ751_021755 [Albula glossodonta]|uniref:Uncharacterized protein n=1 Tax=Albula glossodonta TaxID=121402 RepID=A0A8T2NRZ6_9TELE|nr:hypothetical protein JZ751_021755 [Albula glossodonta]
MKVKLQQGRAALTACSPEHGRAALTANHICVLLQQQFGSTVTLKQPCGGAEAHSALCGAVWRRGTQARGAVRQIRIDSEKQKTEMVPAPQEEGFLKHFGNE